MDSRIGKIFSNFNKKLDAFIIVNSDFPNLDPNFFYISGITSGVFEYCWIIARKDGKGYLITSELEESIARKETGLEILVSNTKEKRKEQLEKLLSEAEAIGINGESISYQNHELISKLTKAKTVDISKALEKTRSIKDKDEIKKISEACRISSKAANEFPDYVKNGVTEKGLAKKLVELQYSYGADDIAFSPIVAFGNNSSSPHHSPTDRVIKKNEFVLTDFGAGYRRYASDLSRTFVFGKTDKKMKEIYETVLDAQVQAIDMVKEGVNGKDIDRFARDIIDKKFKGSFIHSLGHEVGLQTHDGGALSSQSDFILKKNMVVTVEPGIYIPSVGGVRIEDTILVTKGKPKILTRSPKDFMEI